MAINSNTPSLPPNVNRPNTGQQNVTATSGQSSIDSALPQPGDSVVQGQQPAASAPKSQSFETTPGGQIANQVLEPDATRWFLGSREDLQLATQGKHPEQIRRAERVKTQESREMAALESAYGVTETKLLNQQEAAQQTFQSAESRAAGGFADEHQHLQESSEKLADAQQTFDSQVGTEPRKQLDRYNELSRDLNEGGLSPERQSEYKALQSQLGGALATSGVDVAQLQSQGPEITGTQKLANNLTTAQQELEKANDFPRTEDGTKAWLTEQSQIRDQSIGQAQNQLEQASAELQGQRNSIRGQLQSDAQSDNSRLLERLQDKFHRERDISIGELRPEMADSQAMKSGNFTDIRLGDHGLQAIPRDSKDPVANFSIKSDGSTEIRIQGARVEATSILTPDGEGMRENSEVKNYSVSGDERRLSSEERVRKDADGNLESRYYRTHQYDGRGREETFEKTPTGYTESSSLIGSDGQTYYQRSKTHSVENGNSTTTERTEDSDGIKLEESVTNADGSSSRLYQYDLNNGYSSKTEYKTDSQGVDSKTEYSQRVGSDGLKTTTDRREVDGRLIEEVEIKQIKPDLDAPGLGWIGSHNPQDLVNRFGNDPNMTGENIKVRSRDEEGNLATLETARMKSGDEKRELIQSQGRHGGNTWEMREQNDDGTWNSQVFLQGTKDTIVTKARKEDGFVIEERTSSLEALNKSNPEVPAHGHTVTKSADAASLEQVEKTIEASQIREIKETDSYAQFVKDAGEGSFQVLSSDSTEGQGTELKSSSSLLLETPDGRRLVAMYNDEKKSYMVQTYDAEGKQKTESILAETASGLERVEIDDEGRMAAYKSEGQAGHSTSPEAVSGPKDPGRSNHAGSARNWIRTAEDVMTSPQQVAKGYRALGFLGDALHQSDGNLGAMSKVLIDGNWANRIGVGAGSMAAGLSSISLAADLVAGDYEKASRTAGTLGVDIASISKASQGDVFTGRAAAATTAGKWGANGARVLGVAGLVAGAGFAVYDASQGNYTKAALGAAGSGGAALALFGSASWAGPVGWGVAGAASIGMMAWDYDSSTSVAPYQLN